MSRETWIGLAPGSPRGCGTFEGHTYHIPNYFQTISTWRYHCKLIWRRRNTSKHLAYSCYLTTTSRLLITSELKYLEAISSSPIWTHQQRSFIITNYTVILYFVDLAVRPIAVLFMVLRIKIYYLLSFIIHAWQPHQYLCIVVWATGFGLLTFFFPA